jgi:hypothetical protein
MINPKGVAPMVSYVLAVLVAVVVISGVAVLLNNFYTLLLEDEIKRELTQVSAQTSSKVTEIYSIAKASRSSPGNQSSVLLAESKLNLPDRVALREYKITLLSASQVASLLSNVTLNGGNVSTESTVQVGRIIAETTQDPAVSVEYDVPSIDVDLQGRTLDPQNATMRYYRYNPNGTITDVIVLGDSSLIGQIASMS